MFWVPILTWFIYYPMKQFVYAFMQNGADIHVFRNYNKLKNRTFSADHMLKIKAIDWSTLARIFSIIYGDPLSFIITNTNGIFRAFFFMCY